MAGRRGMTARRGGDRSGWLHTIPCAVFVSNKKGIIMKYSKLFTPVVVAILLGAASLVPVANANSDESVQTATTKQVEQHRLQMVVGRMSDSYSPGVDISSQAGEERITSLPGSFLKGTVLAPKGAHVYLAGRHRHVQAAAQFLYVGRIGIRFRSPQAVIQVRGVQVYT